MIHTSKIIGVTGFVSIALALTASAQFAVTQTPGNQPGPLSNIDAAEAALLNPNPGPNLTGAYTVINFAGSGGGGDFGNDNSFIGAPSPGADAGDSFALAASAKLTFNTAGTYVFRIGSDDGFRLRLNPSTVPTLGSGATDQYSTAGDRGASNTDGSGLTESAGSSTNALLSYYEHGGGEEVEFSYSLNGGAFQLVGSTPDISVTSAVPEPSTWLAAGGLLLLAAGDFRRRLRA